MSFTMQNPVRLIIFSCDLKPKAIEADCLKGGFLYFVHSRLVNKCSLNTNIFMKSKYKAESGGNGYCKPTFICENSI